MSSVKYVSVVLAIICASHSVSGQGYYPLSVGDRLDYGDIELVGISYLYSYIITAETTMANGKTYAVRRAWTRWGFTGMDFLRQDGSRVYELRPTEPDTEDVFVDFTHEDGDTVGFWTSEDDSAWITVRVGVGNYFGRQLRSWVYSAGGTSPYFEPAWWVVIDSIGFGNSWYSPGSREYLMGAIVNGIQYGTITAIEHDASEESQPAGITTLDAFPNPFNHSSSILYSVPAQAHVRLAIYDILGRDVSVLVDEEKAPGLYRVAFEAGELASGLYLCRYEAGGSVLTRGLFLLR